jgi:hypothetical protein
MIFALITRKDPHSLGGITQMSVIARRDQTESHSYRHFSARECDLHVNVRIGNH